MNILCSLMHFYLLYLNYINTRTAKAYKHICACTLGRDHLREMDQLSEEVIQAIADRVMKKMETGTSLKQSSSSMDPPAVGLKRPNQ